MSLKVSAALKSIDMRHSSQSVRTSCQETTLIRQVEEEQGTTSRASMPSTRPGGNRSMEGGEDQLAAVGRPDRRLGGDRIVISPTRVITSGDWREDAGQELGTGAADFG